MTAWIANGSVYDDFRPLTVGTALSGRTSDSGHTWVQYVGTWAVQAADVIGNRAGAAAPTGHSRIGIDFGSADVSVEVTVHIPAASNSSGVMFRRTTGGFYVFRVAAGAATTLDKVTSGGTITNLGTGSTTTNSAALKVVCSGSTIDCYIDDVLDISVTDSTYAGTVHGMYMRFGGTGNVGFYAFNMHPAPATRGLVVGFMTLN